MSVLVVVKLIVSSSVWVKSLCWWFRNRVVVNRMGGVSILMIRSD